MKKLVFIIDDDPVYLKFMEGHFSLLDGFVTEVYPTGDAALINLTTKKPFLIILDHHLDDPNKNGLFYLKEIRKKESKVPIIYITIDTDPSLKEKVERLGVSGFIYKNEAFLVYLRTLLDDLLKWKRKSILGKFFK